MQLQNYLYFITVAEELNMTRAAEKLFITQQTLSGQISKLEKQYNAVFFTRRPKLKLTKEGEHFLAFAKEVVAAEKRFYEKIDNMHKEEFLKIGNSSSRGRRIIASSIRLFAGIYPNTNLSLVTSDLRSLQNMLISGEIDAFTSSMPVISDQFGYDIIYHSDLVYVCPMHLLEKECTADYFKSVSDDERVRIISQIPISISPETFPMRNTINRFFEEHHCKPSIKTEISTAAETFVLCKEGISAAFLPLDSLLELLKEDQSVDNLFFWRERTIDEIEPFAFCYRKDNDSAQIRTLKSLLREQANLLYIESEKEIQKRFPNL